MCIDTPLAKKPPDFWKMFFMSNWAINVFNLYHFTSIANAVNLCLIGKQRIFILKMASEDVFSLLQALIVIVCFMKCRKANIKRHLKLCSPNNIATFRATNQRLYKFFLLF